MSGNIGRVPAAHAHFQAGGSGHGGTCWVIVTSRVSCVLMDDRTWPDWPSVRAQVVRPYLGTLSHG